MNPIFSEKDGGDEELRTGTSHRGNVTLDTLEGPGNNDQDSDDDSSPELEDVPDSLLPPRRGM